MGIVLRCFSIWSHLCICLHDMGWCMINWAAVDTSGNLLPCSRRFCLCMACSGVGMSQHAHSGQFAGAGLLQALEKRLKDDAAQRRLAQQFEVHAVTDLPNCNIVEARTNGKAS